MLNGILNDEYISYYYDGLTLSESIETEAFLAKNSYNKKYFEKKYLEFYKISDSINRVKKKLQLKSLFACEKILRKIK